ncbi:MAG: VOC family protein [Paucibacter sp.]|nr:VOC family protein [Roseateles sp.]
MHALQKITPCLWFDSQAEEAVEFYTTIFRNSKVTAVARYGDQGQEVHGRQPGSVMTIAFELDGQTFTALNGGPLFQFSEAVSLQVNCESQDEVDYFWDRLSADGPPEAQQCGWLKDKFGLSWQIVPTVLPQMMSDRDPARTGRVMAALLQMKKLDIGQLKKAYAEA